MQESSPFTPVHPVKPVAPYIGGKRNLAKRLVALIETIPHRTYAEPFVGMGGVFLRRSMRPPAEVINDWSRDIYNLYRVLQEHYGAFLDLVRFQITTRAGFERLLALDPDRLTDMQRAARFLYVQRVAFGGKVTGRSFGVSHHAGARFNINKLGTMLEDVHERLAGVVVENLPYGDFLRRYDTPETLFYLDPPYWGSEGDYGEDLFGPADFVTLVGCLKALRGRFVLSINDLPETRRLFEGFRLEAVGTTYAIQGGGQPARELIVMN